MTRSSFIPQRAQPQRGRVHACSLLALCLWVGAPVAPVAAEVTEALGRVEKDRVSTVPPSHTWGRNRLLGGHTFLSATFVPTALITTYLGVSTGVDLQRIPNVPFRELGSITLEQVRLGEFIDAGLRLWDGRLGVFGTLAAGGTSGVNVRSLVTRGGNYFLTANGGVIFKLLHLERSDTQLSLRGRIGYETGQEFTLFPLLDALASAPVRSTIEVIRQGLGDVLLSPSTTLLGSGSLALAQPFTRALALQAAVGFTYENTDLEPYQLATMTRSTVSVTTTTPEIGIAFSADADSAGVPVAGMLEYRVSFPSKEASSLNKSSSRVENLVALGVYYSGRRDLQTGLLLFALLGGETTQGQNRSGEATESAKRQRFGSALMMRYFW